MNTIDWFAQFDTTQKIFDFVINHLHKQGRRSFVKNRGCRYLMDDNLKCAVGCLIPIELYDPIFEGDRLSGIIKSMISFFDKNDNYQIMYIFMDKNSDILNDLQRLHDNVFNWNEDNDNMENKIVYIANEFKLEYKHLPYFT